MPRGLYNLDFRTWNTKLGRSWANQPTQFYTKRIWTKPTGITVQSRHRIVATTTTTLTARIILSQQYDGDYDDNI